MFGDQMLDNCSVMIMKNETGEGTRISFGCVEKTTMAANCGKQLVVEGAEMNVCCCDGSKCNDDAFLKKCQEKPAPTQSSTTKAPGSKSYMITASFASLMTALCISSLMI